MTEGAHGFGGSATDRLGVSFVVIAYNEERGIAGTLDAIDRLEALGDHEIIVVDDGSADRTAELVTGRVGPHDCVRLVRQANAGRGAARAVGLANASRDLVAMVDADVELPTEWLERCVGELHEGVGAVGGVAIPEGDSTWIHSTFRLDPRPTPLASTVTGNNLLSPRAVIARVGFASELRTAEDVLFVHELEASGYRAVCVPDLVCVHREHKGFGRTMSWMFESGVSATHQLLRFRPPRLPDVAFFGGLVVTVVLAFLFGWQWGVLAVAVWLLAVATGHVRRSFFLRLGPPYAARWFAACCTNSALIGTYFVGRLCGFVLPNPIPRAKGRRS